MITPTFTKELDLLNNYKYIAGIDEVGRGPLAGPVVSAAVILDPARIGKYRSRTKWWAGIRDSKTLSPRRRVSIFNFIKDNSLDWAVGIASHQEIDEFNIHEASLLSMRRAVENLKIVPDYILIDGKFQIPLPNPPHKGEGTIN
ncbi:ribonuclease HII, partial [bacterium]